MEADVVADRRWMERCEELALDAAALGDAAVGAIVVCQGTAVAEASEQVNATRDPTAHAEAAAIRMACRVLGTLNLTGCTLYTNTEPCWMCAFVIRAAGIREVVVGSPVADIGGATSRFPILTDAAVPDWGPPPMLRWLGRTGTPLTDSRSP